MTVSYSPDDSFFVILFARWKGSIWKLVWKWFLVYMSLYYLLYFLYHYMFVDKEPEKEYFRALVWYVRGALPYYPLTFVLGFFVLGVVDRWWTQACLVVDRCKPDDFLRIVCSYLSENTDEETFRIRRALARWSCLLTTFMWRTLSIPILKRFPTEQHIIKAGLMTPDEHQIISDYCENKELEKWIMPGIFMMDTLKKLYKDDKIDSTQLKHCMMELHNYMDAYRKLYFNIWLCMPLVYTHVATIATHVYFLASMLGTQPVLEGDIDLFIPVMTVFQFMFYMGWLLVAQNLFDPFGEDDDDLEMNSFFDRNCRSAFDIANASWSLDPDALLPSVIPHTRLSAHTNEVVMPGSLSGFHLPKAEEEVIYTAEDQEDFLKFIMPRSKVLKHELLKKLGQETREKTIRAI